MKMECLVGQGEETMVSATLDCNIMREYWKPGWARRGDHGV